MIGRTQPSRARGASSGSALLPWCAVIEPFVHDPLPTRVIFGAGTLARLGPEVERVGARRALVLSTPGRAEAQASRIAASLGERSAGVFAGAVMHTPVGVTDEALRVVKERGADAVVAVGGGSTTGLGKAIALRTDLLQGATREAAEGSGEGEAQTVSHLRTSASSTSAGRPSSTTSPRSITRKRWAR